MLPEALFAADWQWVFLNSWSHIERTRVAGPVNGSDQGEERTSLVLLPLLIWFEVLIEPAGKAHGIPH